MKRKQIIKTASTVAGIASGRQIIGLTLQASTRNINGEETRLNVDQIESIRAGAAAIAKLAGVDVDVFATVFDIPPVELKADETLRLEQTTTLEVTALGTDASVESEPEESVFV